MIRYTCDKQLNMHRVYLFPMLLCLTLLYSCLGTKKLGPDQLLYSGYIFKIHKDTVIEGQRKIVSILHDNVYPEVNSKILGIPVKLIVFNTMGKAKQRNGIRGYLKYNYGEPPVLMEDVPVDEVSDYLEDLLKANGYLNSHITTEITQVHSDKKQRKIIYHCYLNPPYHILNITNGIKDTAILRLMLLNASKTVLHANDRYELAKLKEERQRIDHLLKQNGYFYFSPEYLIYKADSTIGKREINLNLQVKPDIEPANLRPWHVNSVLLVNNTVADSVPDADKVTIKGVDLVLGKAFRPKAIRQFVLFEKGDLFTYQKYNLSNKNLSSIGAFKYTNMDISPDSLAPNTLNILVNLVPYEQRNFKAEADIISKSNHFAGPGLGISHTNRNLFGGAEQFTIKLNGSAEAYFYHDTSKYLGNYNYEFETSAELTIPRFLMMRASKFSQQYIPHTHFKIDARYINQMQFYRMSFFRFNYGYQWSESDSKHHELNPADISFQHLLKSTILFDTLLSKNPLLKQSYADQFMVGGSYFYRYALPESNPKRFKTAFTGSLEISGNLLYSANLLLGNRRTEGIPLKLFGAVFSQFIKTTIDYRMYYKTSNSNTFVSRMLIGVGFPLGNSSVLPDIKQYYAGGANSIRAFPIRSLGPGGYGQDNIIPGYLNRTGDVRLEANIENRYRFAKRFELALFLDAGNIWLVENDPLRPLSQFNINHFYRQLAVGWGYGLRYLNDLFVIRLDVGNPLYSPISFSRKPLFNLAVGYPF